MQHKCWASYDCQQKRQQRWQKEREKEKAGAVLKRKRCLPAVASLLRCSNAWSCFQLATAATAAAATALSSELPMLQTNDNNNRDINSGKEREKESSTILLLTARYLLATVFVNSACITLSVAGTLVRHWTGLPAIATTTTASINIRIGIKLLLLLLFQASEAEAAAVHQFGS